MNLQDYWLKLIRHNIWRVDLTDLSKGRALLIKTLRLTYVLGMDIFRGELSLRAKGLVYTSLLSLVPLLAVIVTLLQTFDVHQRVEPLLLQALSPLGDQAPEFTADIMGFVEGMNLGVLGVVGFVLLLYTAVSLIQKMEDAFNYIWRIRHSRTLGQRITQYPGIIIIGPMLVFAAMALTASVTSHHIVQELLAIEPFGSLMVMLGKLTPFFIIIFAFFFVFILMPNTRVKIRAALTAALITGVLWQSTGMLFASFVADSTRYTAIYSGFAILILFMIWLYVGWLIVLLGAQLCYYLQNPRQVHLALDEVHFSHRMQERLCLSVLYLIAEHYYQGSEPWSLSRLSRHLNVAGEFVNDALELLEGLGLIVAAGDDKIVFYPARDLAAIPVAELWQRIRSHEEEEWQGMDIRFPKPVLELMQRIDQGVEQELDGAGMREFMAEKPGTTKPAEQKNPSDETP